MSDLVHSGSASIPGGDEAAGATMLERAAWNLAFNRCLEAGMNHKTSKYHADNCWPEQVSNARAVLMAVREPDEATQNAGVNAASNVFGGWADEGQVIEYHHAIIDAILADGEGR